MNSHQDNTLPTASMPVFSTDDEVTEMICAESVAAMAPTMTAIAPTMTAIAPTITAMAPTMTAIAPTLAKGTTPFVESAPTLVGIAPVSPTATLGLASVGEAALLKVVLEATRALAAQEELADLERIAAGTIQTLVNSDRAHFLFYDSHAGVLWSEQPGRGGDITTGLVSESAKHFWPIAIEKADDVYSYDAYADDPHGRGDERLLIQPIFDPQGQRGVQAVMVAVRSSNKAPFGPESQAALATLAKYAAPVLQQLALSQEAMAMLEEHAPLSRGLFRVQALEAARDKNTRGEVVRVLPSWIGSAYWGLLLLVFASAFFLVLGHVGQYSSGPALIQIASRTQVSAPISGSVLAIEVEGGDQVVEGQVLARLYDADAVAELRRIEQDFDAQIIEVLRNPSDEAARKSAAGLRATKEHAQARVEERMIRAPHAGIVSDVRTRKGQFVQPGEGLMSVVASEEELKVVALLPGGDGPHLEAGQTLRLELSGFPHDYQDLRIDHVGREVIGPSEARRYLGLQVGDSVPIRGPSVLVRATLPASTFASDGNDYAFQDGMLGRAEVRVRSERILFELFPGMRGQ